MLVVITGATGNVGTALLRRLRSADGVDVVGIARRRPDPEPPYDGVEWVSLDLTRHDCVPELAGAFAGADAVVHLAWGFQPSHRPDYLADLGVGGTTRVTQAVARAGVPHLVHMSSVGAYSPKRDDAPVDESYPTDGIARSPYSTHKAAAERVLDDFGRLHPEVVVSRLRPGIIGQRAAGSALLRYGVPSAVPAALIGLLPLLPLDRHLLIPMVHADDVAQAIRLVLDHRAEGAFNLAADPPVTRDDVARALGARPVHVPAPVVRAAASLAWHLRLQQVDPGWIDLAFAVPLLDTGRARRELGWEPQVGALDVLTEVIDGMTSTSSGGSPVLRRRSVPEMLGRMLRGGAVSSRREP